MTLIDCEQRTDTWRQARLGKVTASRVSDLMARTKSGWGASRANYMSELIVERLTGVPTEGFQNAAMAWGTEKEPEAREAYELSTETWVSEVGFIIHPRIQMAGASPDGLVGDRGMLEIKCPNTATHLEALLGQSVPAKYNSQMQWQMACAERAWCDYASYDPRLSPEMRLFVKRVYRDDTAISEMEMHVATFLAELDERLVKLTQLYPRAA